MEFALGKGKDKEPETEPAQSISSYLLARILISRRPNSVYGHIHPSKPTLDAGQTLGVFQARTVCHQA